jgi:hypothetical protein
MGSNEKLTFSRGKRLPSKRVIRARNEMRIAHLLHEFFEDDYDWSKEMKLNLPRTTTSQLSKKSKSKLSNRKRMLTRKNGQENYF